MRPVISAPRRRRALASAFCVLALASCTRDLALPSPPTSPIIAGFTPSAAYAGQLVRVAGTHFAAEAAGNTVNFAHASARADRWDGAELVVRVPADADDGALTVSSREGPAPLRRASSTTSGSESRGAFRWRRRAQSSIALAPSTASPPPATCCSTPGSTAGSSGRGLGLHLSGLRELRCRALGGRGVLYGRGSRLRTRRARPPRHRYGNGFSTD